MHEVRGVHLRAVVVEERRAGDVVDLYVIRALGFSGPLPTGWACRGVCDQVASMVAMW